MTNAISTKLRGEVGRSGTATEHLIDSLQSYKRDISCFARLGPEEEVCLADRIEEGRRATAALAAPDLPPDQQEKLKEREQQGREAGQRMVLANLSLVIHIARRYVRRGRVHGLELLDLIQEGNFGLLKAVEGFKPGYGRFSTYAVPKIGQKINRALAQQSRVIQIPVRVHERLNRMRREEACFLAAKGRPPTPKELASKLDIDTQSLAELQRAEKEVLSLDQPMRGQEEESIYYEDLIEDPRATFVEQFADHQWVGWLLAGLDGRSRRILEWRFRHDLTFEEIGGRENVTGERVRQIQQAALKKLRLS